MPDTDFEAAMAAGEALAAPKVHQFAIEGVPMVAHRTDLTVDQFASLLPRPMRKSGRLSLHTAESFVSFVLRHATSETVVYANARDAKIVAVMNDHDGRASDEGEEATSTASSSSANAGWRDFRADYDCPRTDAWAAWKAIHRKWLSQADFIDFLEDRQNDVAEPFGADLIELLTDLKGKKDVAWQSGVNLQSGDIQLSYLETTSTESSRKGNVAIPSKMALGLSLFRKGSPYKVPARLRYRVEQGALRFCLVIDDIEKLESSAFDDVVDTIRDKLEGVLLLEGAA